MCCLRLAPERGARVRASTRPGASRDTRPRPALCAATGTTSSAASPRPVRTPRKPPPRARRRTPRACPPAASSRPSSGSGPRSLPDPHRVATQTLGRTRYAGRSRDPRRDSRPRPAGPCCIPQGGSESCRSPPRGRTLAVCGCFVHIQRNGPIDAPFREPTSQRRQGGLRLSDCGWRPGVSTACWRSASVPPPTARISGSMAPLRVGPRQEFHLATGVPPAHTLSSARAPVGRRGRFTGPFSSLSSRTR